LIADNKKSHVCDSEKEGRGKCHPRAQLIIMRKMRVEIHARGGATAKPTNSRRVDRP